jgi:putative transposase
VVTHPVKFAPRQNCSRNQVPLQNPHSPRSDLARSDLGEYNGYMPAKNRLKTYVENGYYHIYNRGVEKRTIFQDEQDYGVFLSYLKEYLLPKDQEALSQKLQSPHISGLEKDKILKSLGRNNFNEEIMLLAYCLMPNHFHFFIKQRSAGSVDKFMQSLGTRYSVYFNRKNKRVGPLFQGVYRAVLITHESQFLHLSRYIHKQALAFQGLTLEEKQPSSYLEYIGERNTAWTHPEEVLAFFSSTIPSLTYASFVKDYADSETIFQGLTLED